MGCGASAPAPVDQQGQQHATDIGADVAVAPPAEDKRGATQSIREANHAFDIRATALVPGTNDALTKSRLLWARDTALLDGTSSKVEQND